MQRFLPKLDTTSVQIALKTCLALVLDLAIALQLDWKPSFGAILVVVLQTPALGATYKKGMLYIAGTLSGAITGLALVALFAHDRVAFIVAAALLTSFGIYRLQVSRYPYAWLIFNVTVILVAFFSTQDFSNAFGIAVMRSSTICLAVVIVFLVHGIFWPIQAGTVFERQLHGFMEGCLGLLSLMSRALAGAEPDPDALGKAGTAQVKALAAVRGTLDAAANDTERFRQFHAGYEWLVDQLHNLLLAILVVRERIESPRDDQSGRSLIAASDNVRSMLEKIEGDMQELVRDLARPRDGTASPRASDGGAAAHIDQPGTLDTAFAAMLAGSLRDLARQVSNVRATLAVVEDPGQVPPPRPAPPRELLQPDEREVAQGRGRRPGDSAAWLVLHPDAMADGVDARDGVRDDRSYVRRDGPVDHDRSPVAAQPGHRPRDCRAPLFWDHARHRSVSAADTLALRGVLSAFLYDGQ